MVTTVPVVGLWWCWAAILEAMGVVLKPQMIVDIFGQMDSTAGLVSLVAYIVVVAPILEEVVFRGFVQPPLVRRVGRWGGIVATAGLFAMVHLSDPQAVPPLFILGCALGWLRERTGMLGASIALHIANNAAALVAVSMS